MVTIKNAGLPDDEGLLNPLLEKYKEGWAAIIHTQDPRILMCPITMSWQMVSSC